MIHASADFDFAQTLRYQRRLRGRDPRRRLLVESRRHRHRNGAASAFAPPWRRPGADTGLSLERPGDAALAETAGLTRSAAGIRIAAGAIRRRCWSIGNAPTALDEALRLIEEEDWRPAAIIGMPVGFVGVEEAEGRLLEQGTVPYLTCVGRKGGSAVTAAAVNALAEVSKSDGWHPEHDLGRYWKPGLMRLLEHAKELSRATVIRRYGHPCWRLWHYPAFGSHTYLDHPDAGPKGAAEAPPLVREVTWNGRGPPRVRDLGAGSDSDHALREAALPTTELQRLLESRSDPGGAAHRRLDKRRSGWRLFRPGNLRGFADCAPSVVVRRARRSGGTSSIGSAGCDPS